MANVAVNTAATQLLAANVSATPRTRVTIQNLGPNPITIGADNTVTTGNNLTLATGASITLVGSINGTLFAIATVATQVSPADTRLFVEQAGS